jgi:hypothetical protein
VVHPLAGARAVVVVVVGAMTTATMTAGGLEMTGADATLMSVAVAGVGHQGGALPPGVTTLMRVTGGSPWAQSVLSPTSTPCQRCTSLMVKHLLPKSARITSSSTQLACCMHMAGVMRPPALCLLGLKLMQLHTLQLCFQACGANCCIVPNLTFVFINCDFPTHRWQPDSSYDEPERYGRGGRDDRERPPPSSRDARQVARSSNFWCCCDSQHPCSAKPCMLQ